MPGDRLTRDLDEAMLGGVMAGLARHYDVDATLLRLLAVVAIIPTGGLAIVAYVIAWIIVPRPDQTEAPGEGSIRPLRARLNRDDVGTAAREASDAARRAADRISDAAHLASEAARTAADAARAAADAARTAAEEISDIAHQPPRREPAATPPAGGAANEGAANGEGEATPTDAPPANGTPFA